MHLDKNIHIFTTQKEDGPFSSIADYLQYAQKESGAAACEQVVYEMEQVHGRRIATILTPSDVKNTSSKIPNSDGIITNQKNIVLLIKTADCIPLVYYSEKHSVVAAIHAGWRGLEKGIHAVALKKLLELGIPADEVRVWVGPAIGQCCYFFKDKPSQANKKAWQSYVHQKSGNWYIDLVGYLHSSLKSQGVREENIQNMDACTYHQRDSYLSYRRHKKEGDVSGNMLTVVQLS